MRNLLRILWALMELTTAAALQEPEGLVESLVGPYEARHIYEDEGLEELVEELDVGPYGARHI